MTFEEIFATLPDFATFELTQDGRIARWPASAERLYGYSSEEMLTRPASALRAHDARDITAPPISLKPERVDSFEWAVTKNGDTFWANEITIPRLDRVGTESCFSRVVRDVTSWKAGLDDRDRIFNFSVDMICICDSDAIFRRVNPAFGRILGYPDSLIIGKSFRDFSHPDDLAETRAEADDVTAGKTEPARLFRNRYRCADGTYRLLEWQSLVDPASGMIYAVARDITEQQSQEKRLLDYARELERSNSELQQFAYVASHDLQEPLRAVAGCVQLLGERQAGRLDERSQELMNHAVEGAKRMQALISDLLAFSRVGSKGIAKACTSLSDCIQKAMTQLRTSIEESGAQITMAPLDDVWADSVQITQLFQNLIGNSIKFRADRRPEITISMHHSDGNPLIRVSDNGIGIPEEYKERVFGLFQRLHNRSSYPGTGIGLSICRKIVERHDGQIWVEPGDAGATIVFSLPDDQEQPCAKS